MDNHNPVNEAGAGELKEGDSLHSSGSSSDVWGEEKVLDWLCPPFQSRNQISRQEKTWKWFLNTQEFENWLRRPSQTLFCPGIPGAGKTYLANVVTEHLLKFKKSSSIAVVYVHFNYGQRASAQTHRSLACILRQILESGSDAFREVGKAYERHFDGPSVKSANSKRHFKRFSAKPISEETVPAHELIQLLCSAGAHYSKIYLVIDALDEFKDIETRGQFLRALRALDDVTDLATMFTSRPVPRITDWITRNSPSTKQVDITASADDIKQYVASHLQYSPFTSPNTELCDIITSKADGWFLLAQIHSKYGRTHSTTQVSLVPSFPPSTPSLPPKDREIEEVYNYIFPRIRDSEYSKSAEELLAWVTCAQRPLSVQELDHALRTAPADLELGQPRNIKDIISACAGLVVIDSNNQTVRFCHKQMAAYFQDMKDSRFPDAQLDIGLTCVTYLSFHEFAFGPCQPIIELDQRLEEYCLYDYAACRWGEHVRNSSGFTDKHNQFIITTFLTDKQKVNASAQVMLRRTPNLSESEQSVRQVSGLHLAAYFQLETLLTTMIDGGYPVNIKDSNGQTPLWWATRYNYQSIMKRLCSKDTITIGLLIEANHELYVRWILDCKGNIKTRDFCQRTYLHVAVELNRSKTLEYLIAAGADMNVTDIDGVTPLGRAVSFRRQGMANSLLQHGADPKFIMAIDWKVAFRPGAPWIKLTETRGGGTRLEFLTNQNTENRNPNRFALHFNGNPQYVPWLNCFPSSPLQAYVLQIEDVKSGLGKKWTYFLSVTFPNDPIREHPSGPVLPTGENLKRICIAWTEVWGAPKDGTECWTSMEHFCSLPYLWIPRDGFEFLTHFVTCIEKEWTEICTRLIERSIEMRTKVFKEKGQDEKLLNDLLVVGQSHTDLHNKLQHQADGFRKLAKKHRFRHNGRDPKQFLGRVDQFWKNVHQKIVQLDEISNTLIQLEFNLVSIREARLSTDTSTSMKRLSWITFIFLPLTFVAGLFGMNVDVLESNPPWWLYTVFASGTLIMTFTVWIVFKRGHKLEERIEKKFEWLLKPNGR